MTTRRRLTSLPGVWLGALWLLMTYVGAGFSRPVATAPQGQTDAPVRILIDQSPRAVEYQLGRLTNEELARIERKDDDAKYRLVYVALLTRNGLARGLRDEGLAALVKIDRASATQILLDALRKVPLDDGATADKLATMLLGQPVDTLRSQRDLLARAAGVTDVSPALRAAYGALMIAGGSSESAWQAAGQRAGHMPELLNSVPLLPADAAFDPLRAGLSASIAALLVSPPPAVDVDTRAAAVRALQGLPDRAWPPSAVEGLARAMIALVTNMAPDQRTEPNATDAIQLGGRLAAALPEPARAGVRRELRALGVQVVKIEALPEQMQFTVKWFVVEARKPLQVVLFNPDAMPHNLVIGRPGSLEKLGTTAMTMQMPSDPAVKPYVPAGPLVLQATGLLKEGETERLNLTAPAERGEYVFACTFPGHWVRMYGVMLVVDDLEAWEAAPTTPTDPMTNRPFTAR